MQCDLIFPQSLPGVCWLSNILRSIRVESGGKICSKGSKIPNSCNDVRMKGDDLYLKRDTGEIVQFVEAH